MKYSALLG
ncbi:hypothetical protein U9M48_025587, partial [Paspalum notatum var. saurae]